MERINVDTSSNHPSIAFVQDRETFDTLAVDRATGAILGSHRGDARRPINSALIQAALDVVAAERWVAAHAAVV